MRHPVRARHGRASATATIAGGRTLHTWNDLLGVVPGVFGVKTGHTDDAGWSQVAAVRGDGATIYATILGSPSRTQRNARPRRRCSPGASRSTGRSTRSPAGARYATASAAVRPRRRSRSSPRSSLRRVVRARARRSSQRVVAPAALVAAGARGAGRSGASQIWSAARLLGSRPLVAAPLGRPARGRRPRRLVRAAYSPQRRRGLLTPMIVTVTLNAAIDRTITVPNFQRGQRHRASAGSRSPAARGSTSPAR